MIAVWNDIEDLVNVGAYSAGANIEFDVAVKMKPVIDEFLQQAIEERADPDATRQRLLEVAGRIEGLQQELRSSTSGAAVKLAS